MLIEDENGQQHEVEPSPELDARIALGRVIVVRDPLPDQA